MTINDLDDEILDEDDLAHNTRDDDEEEPKGLSVRDSVEKAWEKHGGDLPEERKSARDRRRDERDTTREGEGRKDDRKPGLPASPSGSKDAAPAAKSEDAPAASIAPPNGWSPEAKAIWAKLPPAVQAAVTKRETDMSAGAKQLQERYGGIHRMLTTELTPYSHKYNLPPVQVMANAVSWLKQLEHDPVVGLRQLAQLYKVDASKLGAAAPAPAPNGAAPNVQPQRPVADPRIDQLMRWAGEMQQTRSNEVQLAKLAVWSPNKQHFEDVRSTMGDLLEHAVRSQDPRFLNEAGSDVDLDKLYQAACQVHPEIGPQIIEEKARADREARQQRLLQKRQAGSSVRSGTPGGGPRKGEAPAKPKKGETVGQTVRRVWDEMRSS